MVTSASNTISATRVGELLRRAREDIGYTQSELASRAGTSQAALSAIEGGSRIPGNELTDRLLRAALLRPSIPLAFYAEELRSLAAFPVPPLSMCCPFPRLPPACSGSPSISS